MRIALYYPWIYVKGGIGRTILEIKRRSRHSWTIFTSHYDKEDTYPEFKDLGVIELKKIPVERSYIKVIKATITILLQKIDLKDFDFLWVHSEGLGDFITFRNHQKPVICFCHTPLKVIHDPYTRDLYFKNNPLKKPFFFLGENIFKFIDKMLWKNYSYVFSVSQEVKERIVKAGLKESESIEVIYRGIDQERIKPCWIYEPYFFHPARIKWWKNIELSIDAFDYFQKQNPQFRNFRLVIAGQIDKANLKYYHRLVKLSRDSTNIQIIPDPSEQILDSLYSRCYAVISTTLNEDWGFTILEAMGYGKPVIAVNRGGPKEMVSNNKTGFLVNPTKEEFSMAMKVLAEDSNLVQKMGRTARDQVLNYTWDKFIKRIDDFIDNFKNNHT